MFMKKIYNLLYKSCSKIPDTETQGDKGFEKKRKNVIQYFRNQYGYFGETFGM